MEREIKIAYFDKDLTEENTLKSFILFCAKKDPLKSKNRLWIITALFLLSKIGIITEKRKKELLLEKFCPTNLSVFENNCFEFAQSVKLNELGKTVKRKSNVVIISEALKSYVQYIFPTHTIIASELKIDINRRIQGLAKHISKHDRRLLLKGTRDKLQVTRDK